MKCSKCEKKAVYYRKFEGQWLCKNHFSTSIEKRARKTIRTCELIEHNDRIAVGISGGKDSLTMLYFLNKITSRRKDVSIFAILIDEGIKGYREHGRKTAIDYCEKLGVTLAIASFEDEYGMPLDKIIKIGKKNDKAVKACTYCGVFRRKLLNDTSRELGATKLAIGHNLDDEAQAIMANNIRGDLLRSARLGAKALVIEDERLIPRIKPLRDIPEKEVALFTMINGIPADFAECPYAEESFRWSVRDMINTMEKKYPGTKYSIVRTFDNLLPTIKEKYTGGKIGACKKCKEPTSNDLCKNCILREKLGINRT
ncbi:MAG: TIGR00269 family protein [DPANN group archaeon]|nr:TIGR00269 family protein [DPANN group archaeon]